MNTPIGEKIETNDARQARRVGLLPILVCGAAIALIGMAVVFGVQSI